MRAVSIPRHLMHQANMFLFPPHLRVKLLTIRAAYLLLDIFCSLEKCRSFLDVSVIGAFQ
jgi:hypothetical protein